MSAAASAAGQALEVDPSQLTLLARPETPADVMAAISAAVQMVWPQPIEPDELDPVHQTWRFSGRWWNKPTPLRRERPWARR